MNHTEILEASYKKITNYLNEMQNPDNKVVDYKSPDELHQLVDFPIAEDGVSQSEFLGFIDQYLKYAVRTGSKQFVNQLYGGFNFPAFIGELFTLVSNTSMYTYEVAPMATEIEREMVRLMNQYSGYKNGNGIFVSGGSNANLVAMFSARNRMHPESRSQGTGKHVQLKAYVNELAHYSLDTAANILGIGTQNIVKVKADSRGRMIPGELEKAIQKTIEDGEQPFFVAATCGTTMMGAYDPIEEMHAITQKYNLWLHADGSFGGSLVLSKQHSHLMNGLEKTDSFAWNPHKLMNIPLICSVLLVKDRDTLHNNITDVNTDYIYHDIDGIEDLGKKSIQCGRRVDSVKLWFAWKYYGIKGYEKRIDNQIAMATYAEQIVINEPKLELFTERNSFSVCFRYIPNNTDNIEDFNLKLRENLRKSGKTMVNYGYLRKQLTIRLIIANGEMQKEDVDRFFKLLLDTANEMDNSLA